MTSCRHTCGLDISPGDVEEAARTAVERAEAPDVGEITHAVDEHIRGRNVQRGHESIEQNLRTMGASLIPLLSALSTPRNIWCSQLVKFEVTRSSLFVPLSKLNAQVIFPEYSFLPGRRHNSCLPPQPVPRRLRKQAKSSMVITHL